MHLELVLVAGESHGGITPRLRVVQDHGLVKELEALHLADCAFGRLDAVEDDECLAFGLHVGLGHQIHDVAVFREDGPQSFLHLIDLDPLVQITHLGGVSHIWRGGVPRQALRTYTLFTSVSLHSVVHGGAKTHVGLGAWGPPRAATDAMSKSDCSVLAQSCQSCRRR